MGLFDQQSVTVLERTVTRGASGGVAYTYAAATPARILDCRCRPPTGIVRERLLQRGWQRPYIVTWTFDPLIDERNRLLFEGMQLVLMDLPQNLQQLNRLWRLETYASTEDNPGVTVK